MLLLLPLFWAVYAESPSGMTRMVAVRETVRGAYVVNTGAAAVLGVLADPAVAEAAGAGGTIRVNVGNMNTFAVLAAQRRLFGLFEHHAGGMTPKLIGELVERLRGGTIDPATFRHEFDGLGAALDPACRDEGPFRFVAVTGPSRRLARPLGYPDAASPCDITLVSAHGLVEGVCPLCSRLPEATEHGQWHRAPRGAGWRSSSGPRTDRRRPSRRNYLTFPLRQRHRVRHRQPAAVPRSPW